MSDIEQITNGFTKLGPGTLYTSIKRLLTAGLIEESEERPDPKLDDERRRYYRLTSTGKRALASEAERMSRLVSYARRKRILKPA